MFSPVLKNIRQAYPNCAFDVAIGTPSTQVIVEQYPEVRNFWVADAQKSPWDFYRPLTHSWRYPYDALLISCGVSAAKSDMFARFCRAKISVALVRDNCPTKYITHPVPYLNDKHLLENNLRLLEPLNIPLPAKSEMYLPARTSPQKRFEKSILIHPGSDPRYRYRRWPITKFVELGKELTDRGWKVSFVLGPSEHDLEGFLQAEPGRFEILKGLSFVDLCQRIQEFHCLVNSDSGLGHIAAALNIPVVSIFGPADPVTSRPFGENVAVVRTSTPPSCMPCIRPGGRYGCDPHPCLTSIDSSSVLEAIEKIPI